jgi:4-amino-4-deoxy-L-arabinose transferase-like glycosyltransferase
MYYDEAIFFNGAVQVLNSGQEPAFAHDPWSWITVLGRRWPVMVMPYVGAVTDYLAVLPFAVFGPNYYTVRILKMILGGLGIWGFSILIRNQFDAQAAAISSWILAIHPAYLDLTIYQGSVVEWMLPMAALSVSAVHYMQARTMSGAFWLGAAMGFGLWSRANIAWLLGSALLACVIGLGKRMIVPILHLAAVTVGGIVAGIPLLWYEIRSHGATIAFLSSSIESGPLLGLIGHRLNLLAQTVLADSELRKMWNGPPLPLWQSMLFSSVVVFAVSACLWRFEWAEHAVAGRVAALTFLFLLAFMLFSPVKIFEHHLIALIPIAAALVVIAARDFSRRWRSARYVTAAIALVYLASALYWNLTAARQIRSTGGVGMWSNAIDGLVSYLHSNYQGRTIKALDWGLTNNLFVLSNGRIMSGEIFWGATEERSGTGKLWADEIAPGDVYLLHSPSLVAAREAGEGFRRALAASALPIRSVRFSQKSGAPYAELLEILPPVR